MSELGLFEFLVIVSSSFIGGCLIGFSITESSWRTTIKKRATDKRPLGIDDCKYRVTPANKIALAKCSPDEEVK